MKILIFAFKGTIAESVANLLTDQSDIIIIKSTISDIEKFIQETDFSHYDYILWMGMYGGRDKDALRIETVCSNQFRNSKAKIITKPIPYFLQPSDGIKFAKGIGNSWCNLVSYKLVTSYHDKPYTFLHIPRSFDADRAAKIVSSQLKRLS